jgi:flagellin-like protein
MKAIIRKDDQAVSPVIATILMVAITVVLAAVLYVMVSGLIGGTNTTSKPTVSLTLATKVSGTSSGADVLVAGITPTAAPSNFKVNVENVSSSTFGTAVAAPTTTGGSATVSAGGQSFTIVWQNPGGSGQISQGDHFVVTSTSIKNGSGIRYAFLLIWSDGSTLTTFNWQA